MKLLLYFCIPLIVTGQVTSGLQGRDRKIQKVNQEAAPEQAGPGSDTSETEAYLNFEYGDDVAYKNAVLENFARGGQRGIQRRPLREESVGKPSAYQSAGRNEGQPSLDASDIYNSLKDKKINGQTRTKTTRGAPLEPSPLAYDAHDPNNNQAALLHAQHVHAAQVPIAGTALLQSQHAHAAQVPIAGTPLLQTQVASPVLPVAPHYAPQLLHYQDPRTGQLLLSQGAYPHHPGLLSAYHPGLVAAPHSKVLADPNQAVLTAAHPHLGLHAGPNPNILAHHSPLALHAAPHTKVLASPHPGLHGGVHPEYAAHAPVLLKSPIDPALAYHQYQAPLLTKQASLGASPALLKSHVAPTYQHPVLLKEAEHLTGVESPAAYHAPLIKSPAVYQPQLLKQPVLLKNTAPAVTYGQVYPALLKQSQLVHPNSEVPLLKTYAGPDARIVPAIEEHISSLDQHLPATALGKVPLGLHPSQITRYVPSDVYPAKVQHHPKVILQKSVLKSPPVHTEKALLKAAYSPALGHHHSAVIPAVAKAPLATSYLQATHLEPGLPATILKSQKSLVKALITADDPYHGKHVLAGGKTVLELVPSLSYGQQSYSLYPKSDGVYGPPQPFHGHRSYANPHHHHHH